MKKTVFVFAAVLFLAANTTSAQHLNGAEHQVMATIEHMFDGMRAGDADMVASTFAEGAVLTTTGERDGAAFSRQMASTQFVDAVRGGDGGWDERIWDVKIEVKDNLASAWMDYAFFLNGEFSHCGVNSFQLARQTDNSWKTVALADTRNSGKCMYDANKAEESSVRAALRHYLLGHATGDGAHHEQVFNEVAFLYWIRDGEFNQRSSAAYIAGASGSPPDNESERVRYIDWVDVTGTSAVGKIVLDYPGAYIVDYMSLLKIDGRWQIVNKIFNVDTGDN